MFLQHRELVLRTVGIVTQVPQIIGCLCKARVQAGWLVSQAGKNAPKTKGEKAGRKALDCGLHSLL